MRGPVYASIIAASVLSALAATLTLAQTGNDPFAPRRLPPAAVPDRSISAKRLDKIPDRPRPRPERPASSESDESEVRLGENGTTNAAQADDSASSEEDEDGAEAIENEGPDEEEESGGGSVDTANVRLPPYDEAGAAACEEKLGLLRVDFTALGPVGENDDAVCGHPRPLRVQSIAGVRLKPEPTVRCEVAEALALWLQSVVLPSAKLHLDATPTMLATTGSYECRKRRSSSSDKYSEHAFANALDIAGISFARRDQVRIKERRDSAEASRAFQAAIRGGACAYFTTVIGPMTNAAHADHLHLDLAERRGGYRLCE